MIYAIQAGQNGPIKIGTAIDVGKRFKSLQCASYRDLSLIRVAAGGAEEERKIHKRLAQYRIRGEWFLPTKEVKRAISKMPSHGNYETTVWCGETLLIVNRDIESNITEPCPFCGSKHSHGKGDGHRLPHCCDGLGAPYVLENGIIIKPSDGYIVRSVANLAGCKPLRCGEDR